MLDVRVIPFLVSELRLTPDEQKLLQREWWPSYAHAVVHRDGVFLFDNGVGFGNAEVESTFSPRVTAIEDALARHGISLAGFTGGDPGITESLGRMCKEEGPEKASRSSEADLLEYVTRAQIAEPA